MKDNVLSDGILSLKERSQGAFLGAAVGDALGWPNEGRTDRFKGQTSVFTRTFQRWVRRSGARYFSHEDTILPGEYSDDTQLILCTARSLLQGSAWHTYLATQELPLWTLYERGGGGSTKRSANAWILGNPPWLNDTKEEDRHKYFEAGGNGVAMRILPHVIKNVDSAGFQELARELMANGVITHGHPRALVGALAYGYALWCALRQQGTLEYGGLINSALIGSDIWAGLPDINEYFPSWRVAAEEHSSGQYQQTWRVTVEEVRHLLEDSRQAMQQGALSVDNEVLHRLGCFDKSVNGAGTIAAAAAIFLASRYAADPIHGLLEAAFAYGSDTDTIASMTSALLGAVGGMDWLADYAGAVQDTDYIQMIALKMAQIKKDAAQTGGAKLIEVRKANLESTLLTLKQAKTGDTIILPDARKGMVSSLSQNTSLAKAINVVSWKVITTDGQTIYVKRISRNPQQGLVNHAGQDRTTITRITTPEVVKIWVKIPVSNIEISRNFYNRVLGINILKESQSFVSLQGSIALIDAKNDKNSVRSFWNEENKASKCCVTVCIETQRLDAIHDRVRNSGANIINSISYKQGRRFFACSDPDHNTIEVFESPHTS